MHSIKAKNDLDTVSETILRYETSLDFIQRKKGTSIREERQTQTAKKCNSQVRVGHGFLVSGSGVYCIHQNRNIQFSFL